jgi:hypothetical protein
MIACRWEMDVDNVLLFLMLSVILTIPFDIHSVVRVLQFVGYQSQREDLIIHKSIGSTGVQRHFGIARLSSYTIGHQSSGISAHKNKKETNSA